MQRHHNVIDVVPVALILTLSMFHTFFSVSVINFEKINVSWDKPSENF